MTASLSIVIPVFNEAATLPRILVAAADALPEVSKEIILVDDGSSDGTREWIRTCMPHGRQSVRRIGLGADGMLLFSDDPVRAPTTIRCYFHTTNRGKGAALSTGLAAARGEVIVIQDADLEYDPIDWTAMYELIAQRKVADVVFGSRLRGGRGVFPYRRQYAANALLSALFSLLYGQRLTDIEVCYKMFTRAVGDGLRITCSDFGCEIEMSAQIVRSRRWRIKEIGIAYRGRRYDEGKRIGWRDGIKALWYLLHFRVLSLPRTG